MNPMTYCVVTKGNPGTNHGNHATFEEAENLARTIAGAKIHCPNGMILPPRPFN